MGSFSKFKSKTGFPIFPPNSTFMLFFFNTCSRILHVVDFPFVPVTTIDFIVPNQPAENAGLQVGDAFIEIEGKSVDNWNEAVEQIEKCPNETITISFDRQGEINKKEITLTSRPNLTTGRVDQEVGVIGISKTQVPVELNFVESFVYGFNETKGLI